ncbi:MAG: bifunctional homocysteine S-methyltransferase/methylenetetrahydrofolate reductase [Chloroflexi bacterium]|nr:bifunctional homocysteine S-methyltransferase/methylenetetrahydrofolate reductase [Chloroflexota bacterium]
MNLLERLSIGPLLADGAMGTMLYARGVDFEECFDALNLNNPEVVADVHRLYAAAGADILETNTFGANRFKLEHHSLSTSVTDINARGVELARQAARDVSTDILIAGSVGPLGVQLAPLGPVKHGDAYEAFYEQISALADAGADLIILETFSDVNEIEQAIRATRAACRLPVVAQMTFTRDNLTAFGSTPELVVQHLCALGADIVGANCSTGPRRMLDVLGLMQTALQRSATSLPPFLSAMPNAGFPEVRAERLMYPATPEYFGDYARRFIEAGVRLVGGCCGTTPAHTQAMRLAIDGMPSAEGTRVRVVRVTESNHHAQAAPPALGVGLKATSEPTQLGQALLNSRFVVTVEVEPPKSSDTEAVEETARMLKEAGASVLDIADSPMARMRMSGLAVAHRVQERAGIETVLHFPVRGRNLLRVQGDLLAAHALNIRNVFVVMGDPTRIGDYPQANDHHDVVPTGLAQMIKEKFNQGMDSAGSSIGRPCSFIIGMAANLCPSDLDKEAALLHKKIQCGADFAITQPIFDVNKTREFLTYYQDKYGKLALPLVAGIMPLASARHAEFMRNEVPGIIIPDGIIERLQKVGNKTRTEGVLIARETIAELRSFVQGIYLIPAFSRYDILARVIRESLQDMGINTPAVS